MKALTPATRLSRLSATGGFSLVELLVSMGILTVVLGAALGGMANMMSANETVIQMSTMNNGLRTSMDLIVRDMLQVGSGLPSGRAITIASGGGTPVRLPGPPGTNYTTTDAQLQAVIPRPAVGPILNGQATDVITVLMADNTFLNVALSAVAGTFVVVAAGPNIETGPDRVTPGQLMMISKGATTTLVQVTTVDTVTRRLTFADGDSLSLNQAGAPLGNLPALNATAPVNSAPNTNISRIRMITYYIDATTQPTRPRLVRRINNGHPTTFNNALGTAVALDVENLFFSFDINNGGTNPGNVRLLPVDLTTGGACAPVTCSPNQVRKLNIALTGRSRNAGSVGRLALRNTLQSQIALRGMAFRDRFAG